MCKKYSLCSRNSLQYAVGHDLKFLNVVACVCVFLDCCCVCVFLQRMFCEHKVYFVVEIVSECADSVSVCDSVFIS